MVAKKLKVGQEVEVKLINKSAALTGPFAQQTPKFVILRGMVQPMPDWERMPDCFCLAVQGDIPLRIIHMSQVVEINGKKGAFAPDDGREVFTVKGSKGNSYTVTRERDKWTCTCPGFGFRHHCKHIQELSEKK